MLAGLTRRYWIPIASMIGVSIAAYVLLGDLPNRFARESSPIARGAATPGIFGCLGCHGKTDKKLLDDWLLSCEQPSNAVDHPSYKGKCDDLLAFFGAVRLRNTFDQRVSLQPSNRLLAGERLARKYYCFQCHGELGQGGFPNHGSFKGYIPGYFGNDFRLLTNNASPEAVTRWIQTGTNPDLLDGLITGPIAAYFFNHQTIQMPQFDSLSDGELALLVDYLLSIQAFGPLDNLAIQDYDKLTRLRM